jgi:hypothetical protein
MCMFKPRSARRSRKNIQQQQQQRQRRKGGKDMNVVCVNIAGSLSHLLFHARALGVLIEFLPQLFFSFASSQL